MTARRRTGFTIIHLIFIRVTLNRIDNFFHCVTDNTLSVRRFAAQTPVILVYLIFQMSDYALDALKCKLSSLQAELGSFQHTRNQRESGRKLNDLLEHIAQYEDAVRQQEEHCEKEMEEERRNRRKEGGH